MSIKPDVGRGRADHPEAVGQRELLELIRQYEPAQALRTIRACRRLAYEGDEEALRSLVELANEPNGVGCVSRAARVLINHRLGLKSDDFPDEGPVLLDVERGAALQPSRLDQDELARILVARREKFVRLSLQREHAVRLDCGRSTLAVVLSEHAVEMGPWVLARRQPVILGLVLDQAPDAGTWEVRGVILAGPAIEERSYVGVLRPDGILDLWGTFAEGERSVRLRTVGRPGAVAVDLLCHYAGGVLNVTGISSLTRWNVSKVSPIKLTRLEVDLESGADHPRR